MLRLTIVLCLVAACFGGRVIRNRPARLDGRIVGGTEVNITEIPWQLSFIWQGSHACGASIISDEWAISAAHCCDGFNIRQFQLRSGSSIRNVGGTVHDLTEMIVHELYDDFLFDYDFTLLKVATPFVYGPGVAPIALPAQGQDTEAGVLSRISGWGATSYEGPLSDQLLEVYLPVSTLEYCQAYWSVEYVTPRMICAGEPAGGIDSCQGDSGGPMVVNNEIVGLTSWGEGCAWPDTPGVYARVSSVRDWITTNSGV